MKFATLQQILTAFKPLDIIKPSELALRVGKNRDTVHKYLKILVEQGKLIKQGKTPHVTYSLPSQEMRKKAIHTSQEYNFNYQQIQVLDQTFLKYSAKGDRLYGTEGFFLRCEQRGLDPMTKYQDYESIYNYLQTQYNNCGVLDATQAFAQHVKIMHLDAVYYADQYRWMEFGRGKLAEMTFYAKQSQNYALVQSAIDQFVRKLECLIKTTKVDAIALTPASIKRQYQLLDLINARIKHITLPRINLVKYYPHKVIIPQKSLKSRSERLQNAQETIFIYDQNIKNYHKVLLIDDFVGSGSTLNETAGKLKVEGVAEVIGFAIVGNMDLSYEVINEV
jgi:predicted amidophosphoribosyltransferase/predicted transcriptional regulator